MDATFHALGGLLLRAIPTFILIIFLDFYLKGMFFRPMGKVLARRYEATEGARKAAEQSLEHAAAKTAEYEAAMRKARAEVYQNQERLHRELQAGQATQLAAARQEVEAGIQQVRKQLTTDVEGAKVALARESEMLGEEIAGLILRGSAQ
jgi:F-type H+-transporting ATPase subunit b